MALYDARQSVYVDGDNIDASDSNDEFDRLLAAFNKTSGHKHDGSTTGDGPKLVVVGALDSGSITSGFGTIDTGVSNITTGGILKIDVDGTAENSAGSLTMGAGNDSGIFFNGTDLVIITNGAGASGIILDSEDDTFEFKGSGTVLTKIDTGGIDLATGDAYEINNTSVLNATTLGTAVVTSSLTTVGALNSGSITSGFGNINTGSSTFDCTGVHTGPSGTWDTGGIDIASGDSYAIAGTDVLVAATLGTGVLTSSLTTVGALNSGSITSGFGTIDTGVSNITTGGILKIDVDSDGSVDSAGSLTMGTGNDAAISFDGTDLVIITDGSGASGIILDSEDDTYEFKGSGTVMTKIDAGGVDIATGDAYEINNTSVLNATTLGSSVIASSLTSVGTITTGVWNGTDITVAGGGTGVDTLTDGGVLLGSGTDAITAMAVLGDGEMIVGNGTTDPVAESGATLRASIGAAADGAIIPDLVTLGAASADGEIIVATGAGVFAYESGSTLRASIGVGTGNTPVLTGVQVGDGSASVPTLTFSADTNCGIFRVPNDKLCVTAGGGSECARFSSGSGSYALILTNGGTTDPFGLYIDFSGAHRANNTEAFLKCEDDEAVRCYIFSDGDLQNVDNAYGAISDRKLKQDITPARSQWDDVKRLADMAVNFRFITDVATKGDDAKVLLGLVAQDAEEVSPGLVRDVPDMEEGPLLEEDGTPRLDEDGNPVIGQRPTGTITKGLVFSVLYMKAVVALGEALNRIEALELKVGI